MNIIHLYFDNHNIILQINWLIIAPIACILVGFYIKNNKTIKKFFKSIEIDCAELNINGQKLKLRPNNATINVAYKIWVEITTRKIGQEIDYTNDVIEEIYNSWYEFFKVTRELLKQIPAEKATEPNTKKIIKITISILNEVIRPHLTKWQARFRFWYDKTKQYNISPQKRQVYFNCPENEKIYNFSELKSDMTIVNKTLIEYKKILENIIF